MRNMLQLNNGNGTFSDIGQMAGVARTDWSWSALIADLDLDGYKDIYVTNGIAQATSRRRTTSRSWRTRRRCRRRRNGGERRRLHASSIDAMTLDAARRTTRSATTATCTFANEAAAWGLDTPSFSSGAAYGDLDGDGALDLVVNNVNDEAFVYRNNARTLHTDNHYLQVRLEGEGTEPVRRRRAG